MASRKQELEGGDVEEEEEEEEKLARLVWLGERLVRNPLTQATIDIDWEEEQMMAEILTSSEAAPVTEELVTAMLPALAATLDCEARQRLFKLLALSSRAE